MKIANSNKIVLKTILWICSIVVFLLLTQVLLIAQQINKKREGGINYPLVFTISADKNEYSIENLSGIIIKGIIKNVSKSDEIINTRFLFPTDIDMTFEDEKSEVLKWLPPAPPRPLTKNDFRTIRPGQQVEFNLNIYSTNFYGKLKSGTYKIKAKYKNSSGDEFSKNVWSGILESNTISIILN